jgi:hypothetical protein
MALCDLKVNDAVIQGYFGGVAWPP